MQTLSPPATTLPALVQRLTSEAQAARLSPEQRRHALLTVLGALTDEDALAAHMESVPVATLRRAQLKARICDDWKAVQHPHLRAARYDLRGCRIGWVLHGMDGFTAILEGEDLRPAQPTLERAQQLVDRELARRGWQGPGLEHLREQALAEQAGEDAA